MGVLEEQEKECSPAASPKPHFASGADEHKAVLRQALQVPLLTEARVRKRVLNLRHKFLGLAVLATSFITVLVLFAVFFEQIPTQNNTLAMDWKTSWASIRGGNLQYWPVYGIRFPPWSLVPLLPLGLLPMQTAWGILAGVGVFILVVSVPRTGSKPVYWLSILLLVISFPSIRNIADGNMENIVVAGVLLILYGYSSKHIYALVIGILLATIKLQEVTLLLIVVAIYVLLTWTPRNWLKMGLWLTGGIALSLIWRGQSWFVSLFGLNYLKYTSSIIDISISAAFRRLGFIPSFVTTLFWIAILGITLFVAWKSRASLSREKAGMLIAGSLLIAPYAAGNSVLSVLAIGMIPLFQSNLLLGGILIALVNLPFLWSTDVLYNFQSYYWTVVVLIIWAVLVWRCLSAASQLETVEGTP